MKRPRVVLLLALAAIAVYGTSIDLLKEDQEDHRPSVEASDESEDTDTDSTALFQTYVRVASKSERAEDGVNEHATKQTKHTLERMWQWVTQASTEDVAGITDPAQRSHKDFIAAALLITCILPWSCQGPTVGDGGHRTATHRVSRMLPSGQTLRYLCVALLWSKHYYFKGQNPFVDIFLVVMGVIFDFAEQHIDYEEDMWRRLSECVPQHFARLYPFYGLHVLICYLLFFSTPYAAIEELLDGNLLPFYACGLLAWASSLIFAIYLVVVLLSQSAEHLQPTSVAMLHAGCIAMIALPRTLAAPVHGPWAWSEEKASLLKASPDATIFDFFFARRSLLLALSHFFLGLVLARIRLFIMADRSDAEDETSKEPQVESVSASSTVARDEDIWREFEEEAKRDMMHSLSISKAAESRDSEEYSVSPRSNLSD